MYTWIDPAPVNVPPELEESLFKGDLSPSLSTRRILLEALVRRGFTTLASARAFLDPEFYTPAPPSELPDLEKTAVRLEQAIRDGEKICVWGDFDVDGQTSTSLLVEALRGLGAKVFYHIPVRDTESHGVNLENLQRVIEDGAALVLTCDTGISAHAAANYAQQRGVDFLVTDHHELPEDSHGSGSGLPQAYSLVNPHFLPADHPLAGLPGVGVAYKLAEALYTRAGRGEEAERFLDLAALGIVADVATQLKDTRYLLQRGLKVLRKTGRMGLRMVMESAGVNPAGINEEHIGFMLAPRLNALGRLDDANPAVELLTGEDERRAGTLIEKLEIFNNQRRLLTRQVFNGARAMLENDRQLQSQPVLVLANPEWHPGVLGIAASHLAELYGRPVILISAPPGAAARGSARSVEGINITEAIRSQADMLAGYGGHAMAAGLSFAPADDTMERIVRFRQAIGYTVEKMTGGIPAQPSLNIDAYLPFSEFSLELVCELDRLAPFGAGNPSLTFAATGLRLVSRAGMGREEEHLSLIVGDESGIERRVIWWQGAGSPLPEGKFDMAFTLRASTYNGKRELQVEWVDYRPAVEEAGSPVVSEKVEVIDYRRQTDPRLVLENLRSKVNVLVWAEAAEKRKVGGVERHELHPTPDLVIWTAPPGPQELRSGLAMTQPERVHLFAVDPQMDQAGLFLKRLAGLLSYTLNHENGQTTLDRLASATCQRQATVQAGLRVLEQRGLFLIADWEKDTLSVAAGTGASGVRLSEATELLEFLLEESRAYRKYFQSTNAAALVEKLLPVTNRRKRTSRAAG